MAVIHGPRRWLCWLPSTLGRERSERADVPHPVLLPTPVLDRVSLLSTIGVKCLLAVAPAHVCESLLLANAVLDLGRRAVESFVLDYFNRSVLIHLFNLNY